MKEKYPKYLPIGSVVLLEKAEKKLMITGFLVKSKDPDKDDKTFDYCGVLYPEGTLSTDIIAVFNHDQISQIYALGYSNEEEKEFKAKLNNAIADTNKI